MDSVESSSTPHSRDQPLANSSVNGCEASSPLLDAISTPEADSSDNACSALSKLLAARASSLRRCTTVVTRPDGRCYQETRTALGFTALGTSSGQGNAFEGEERACIQNNQKEQHLSLVPATQGELAGQPTVKTNINRPPSRINAMNSGELDRCSPDVSFNSKCPGFVIDTKPDLRCSVILPYLLLGSQDVANDRSILDQHRVTHVLSLVPPSIFSNESQKVLQSDGAVVTIKPPLSAGVCPGDGIDFKSPISLNPNQDTKAASQGHPSGLFDDAPSDTAPPSSECRLPPEIIHAPMLDMPEHPIHESFPACHRFIAGIKRTGGVALVHCNAGVSRAPTVVIAYIMAEYGLSYEEALRMVREKRSFIRPNAGFVEKLKQYESLLKQDA